MPQACPRGASDARSRLSPRRHHVVARTWFNKTPTLFSFVRLEDRLAELLGTKVDLVMKSGLKPTIGARILAEVVSV
jgi:hypothetical protein